MELFKDTNFDFLGKKWPFIIGSLVLTAIGVGSLIVQGGPRYGIDFKGGALVYVRFGEKPPVEKIRTALGSKIQGEISVQEVTGANEVMIGTELREEKELDAARRQIIDALGEAFGDSGGKLDLNNTGQQRLIERLREPLQRNSVPLSEQELESLVARILQFRDTPPRSGVVASFDQLSALEGVTPAVTETLKQETYLAPFSIRSVEVVGPKIGAELRMQAILATLYALGGMLIYIAFRFEWIYGVAAVLAVVHDTVITVGLFSVFDKEISLTVIAALLTLVGYSMNDTIVIFDRIRENLKVLRREALESLINRSVNQTLSRTVMVSGLTFLTALSLYLFGGQVLNGFSFALVVGIAVGTYSSIFIASPILIFWHNYRESRKKASPVAASAGKVARKGSSKVVR